MPTSGPLRGLMVISALWRCFSMARMTLLSNLSPRILRILDRPVSTDLRRAGVISHFLPVNSTFMSSPFFPDHIHATSGNAGGGDGKIAFGQPRDAGHIFLHVLAPASRRGSRLAPPALF